MIPASEIVVHRPHGRDEQMTWKRAERSYFRNFVLHATRNDVFRIEDGKALPGLTEDVNTERLKNVFAEFEPILICHDWASVPAFKEVLAETKDPVFVLPFPQCVFEFQIKVGDKPFFPVLAICDQRADKFTITIIQVHKNYSIFLKGNGITYDDFAHAFSDMNAKKERWEREQATYGGLRWRCLKLIAAACLAIETKIGIPRVIPIPPKLVKARIRRDTPDAGLRPYRVIDLARLSSSDATPGDPTGRKVSFHLRCAHYWPMRLATAEARHAAGRLPFEEIEWRRLEEERYARMRRLRPAKFVGTPDLERVDHEYRI